MSFAIEIFDEISDPKPTASGLIRIGSFQERFTAPLDFWGVNDYRRHWCDSVDFLICTGKDSCLITAMHNPNTANFIQWWLLYPRGNRVFIQNQLLFLSTLSSPFNIQRSYFQIPARQVINDEGVAISEWESTLNDFVSFRLKQCNSFLK
jgi:contact-dependent growth inhibition (CDI) system CdiI-like immunity protein